MLCCDNCVFSFSQDFVMCTLFPVFINTLSYYSATLYHISVNKNSPEDQTLPVEARHVCSHQAVSRILSIVSEEQHGAELDRECIHVLERNEKNKLSSNLSNALSIYQFIV